MFWASLWSNRREAPDPEHLAGSRSGGAGRQAKQAGALRPEGADPGRRRGVLGEGIRNMLSGDAAGAADGDGGGRKVNANRLPDRRGPSNFDACSICQDSEAVRGRDAASVA